jgi:hypothetical protein
MPRVPPPTDDKGSADSSSKPYTPVDSSPTPPTTKKETAGSLFRIPLKPLAKAPRTTSSHHDDIRDRIIKDMEDFELMYTL